jgi:hypothetical protein
MPTEMENYIADWKTKINEAQQILILRIENKGKNAQAVASNSMGNFEFLIPGVTFDLILIVDKNEPTLRLTLLNDGDVDIEPKKYSAIFQNGQAVLNTPN